eukprot:CAMPEP_0202862186 /NCGR_PEP_ID=MMETSP1391-20130828/3319_1 /ASSEMBLY_ACC=CAM_ASM_000867 /TAXON_ID=1034604 /ORGANISM="Chlamydomonas leiostraca, Strain SAG 11-49" /LENGTH=215 /DNA_ID=CAMNT_0049541683 /DNA_START=122 /DNA_END=769 /DNA_ORIENTATION=-
MALKDLHGDTFFLDAFAIRQWDDPNYGGTRISYDKAEFVAKVHEMFKASGAKLVDGYAPFCKHVFVPNFVGAKVGALRVSDDNRHLLRSGYTKRRPEELAVLSRWFRACDVTVPDAAYLDLILYSREQLVKEYAAMPTAKGSPDDLPNVPWGIISVKAQYVDYETPMQPITMLRNALGREEGGSGVPLDRDAYSKSVEYWENHATITLGDKPNGE